MGNLAPIATGLAWVFVGLAVGVGHLWALHRILARADALDAGRAGTRIALTFPLRLLAVAPVLFLAARSGLWACLGFVAGSLAGRWMILGLFGGQGRHPFRWLKQG